MEQIKITGFDLGADPAMPNSIVRKFIIDSFSQPALSQTKLARIIKIPLIIIYVSPYLDKEVRKNLENFLFS